MIFTLPQPVTKGRLRAEIVFPSAEVTPPGQVSFAFDPASPVELSWGIKPLAAGKLDGTIWVNASLDGSTPQAVLARSFQMDSRTILGVSALWIRRIGFGFFIAAIFSGSRFSPQTSFEPEGDFCTRQVTHLNLKFWVKWRKF